MNRYQPFLIIFPITILFSLKSEYYSQPLSNSNNSPNFIFILEDISWMVQKIIKMRIFDDSENKLVFIVYLMIYFTIEVVEKIASRI